MKISAHTGGEKMKKVILVLVSVLFVFCLVSWFALPNAEASDFLGDFCWKGSFGGKNAILKLGVSDMGGGHFQLNGVVTLPNSHEAALIGNAEFLSGNRIDAVLIYSGRGTNYVVTGTINLSLYPSTLNGTFNSIELDAIITNPSYQTPTAYTTVGTASLIPCP